LRCCRPPGFGERLLEIRRRQELRFAVLTGAPRHASHDAFDGLDRRVVFIGENKGTIEISPSHDMIRKGLKLSGCWHMNMNDAPDLIQFLQRAPEKADLLISHQFGMDQVQAAFNAFECRETAKVLLLPSAQQV
jgi:threonine dehydrogenase-like Zn-dependent dehydrogenase